MVVFPPRMSLVVSCRWLAACPEAVHHDERAMMSFHCKIYKNLQILQRKDVITAYFGLLCTPDYPKEKTRRSLVVGVVDGDLRPARTLYDTLKKLWRLSSVEFTTSCEFHSGKTSSRPISASFFCVLTLSLSVPSDPCPCPWGFTKWYSVVKVKTLE